MNLPNLLTLFRIVLSLVFILLIFGEGLIVKSLALLVFSLASLTDYWDGVIARRFNIITPLGQLLDPIADKVLIFSALFAFVEMKLVPVWMVFLMLFRELFITFVRLTAYDEGKALPAKMSGKVKTVLQIAVILSILVYLIARDMAFWTSGLDFWTLQIIFIGFTASFLVTMLSGVEFVRDHWKAMA